MSTRNFIPELWVARLLLPFNKNLVYGDVVNRDYEGEIANFGDTVRINEIGDVTISDYAGSVTYQELDDAERILKLDQQKYWGLKVADADKAQANVNFMSQAMLNASYGLSEVVDEFIAAKYTEAGNVTAQTAVNSANFLAAMRSLAQALDEKNVPKDGRWAIIPPWMETKGVLAKVIQERGSDSGNTWENGRVGRVAGFDLRVSNNVPCVGGTNYKIMAGVQSAISMAVGLTKTEALRDTDSFTDLLRGLMIYGAKVTRPDALAVGDFTIAAEA